MEKFILIIKGFIMGIANVIPGVSGGTLALTMGIYEKFIGAISHFFSNLKENIKFLLPVFIGLVMALLTTSNVVSICFAQFPIPTALFFSGLVMGGIPMLLNKVKETKEVKKISSYIILLLTFSLVIVLAFAPEIFGENIGSVDFSNLDVSGYVSIILVGIIAAGTMIIPGISGSLVLMLLGYYLPIINTVKALTHFENVLPNILVLGLFGLGVGIGIVLVAKVIEWLLKKYEIKTYFGVIGFIIASVIAIPISVYHEVSNIIFTIPSVLVGIVLLVIGLVIGYKLGEK